MSNSSNQTANLNTILRGYLRAALDGDRVNRIERIPNQPLYASGPVTRGAMADADLAVIRAARARAWVSLANGVPDDDMAVVADLLMQHHRLPEDQRHSLLLGLMEANLRACEIVEMRTMGVEHVIFTEPKPVPVIPLAPAAPPIEALAPAKPLFSALAEKGKDEESPFFVFRATINDATHQVMGQERGTLRRFKEVCGDRPIDAYTRGEITKFMNTMRRCPTTYGKSPRDHDRTLADMIVEADAKGVERLTDKTVKRHLSTLSQFFKWAVDRGYLTRAACTELVEGHSFKAMSGAKDQRDAWLSEELVQLFESAVWKDRKFRSPAKFWLPLLALYHGARLEEFADLYGQDIGCDNGTWFIRIREHGNRRLKNANADRTVPLHPELIRLGFPEYVAKVASEPRDPLFADIAPQGHDGKRGPRLTRWFVEYRRKIGLYRKGVGMHAFRHTANTRLRDVMVTEQHKRHINYLLGHSQGGGEGEGRYDKGPGLKALAETLALLRYPELDLSHLYVDV